MMCLVKWTIALMVQKDLENTTYLSKEDALVIQLGCQQLADATARQVPLDNEDGGERELTSAANLEHLETVAKTIRAIDAKVKGRRKPYEAMVLPPKLTLEHGTALNGEHFRLFGRLRRDYDVEQLSGGSAVPPILRPIELTAVADSVETFNDVATAMRKTVHLCTLLGNQSGLIKNTYCMRVALIQHLFTQVIPLPLPHNHPDRASRCFWHSQGMRYETQADLLRLLELLARHFTSSVFSLRVTRSFDAARIVTMACIATLSDCILRKVASDVPSQFSLHFSGEAEGPVSAYGFEMGYFLEESGFLSVPDAFICTARTQILDYFTQQKKLIVDDDHIIFRFERDMSFGQGEKNLMDQLCVQMGFVRGSQELPMYLTGRKSADC